MAQPWQTIESVPTKTGLLALRKRGERDFLITIDGRVLMNSQSSRSEEALGELACAHLKNSVHPRILIGGLGMGFTLKAVLNTLPATARVKVAELNPVVVKWCLGPLATLTEHAVSDARVQVDTGDVKLLIRSYATDNALEKFDAIILDLYTGPYMHSHKRDDPLYGISAMKSARSALKPGGIFAVWGEAYDAGFVKRMTQSGFQTSYHQSWRGGPRHVVYLGRS